MIDTILLDFWSKIIGLDNQLQALGTDRTTMAENLFDELTELENADELRHRLAFGNKPSEPRPQPEDDQLRQRTNDDLALVVLADAFSCAREGRSNEEGLVLVDWLQFVAQYGTQSNLFQAHSKLLEGLFYQSDKNDHDATTSFKESLERYEYLPDEQAHGPSSICAYCLGVISIDSDEFDESEGFSQRARELAVTTAVLGWRDYIEREVEAANEQRLVVNKLTEASLEADVTPLVEQHNKIISDRTIKILQSRAFRAAVRGEVKDAIAVATVADRVSKSLGKQFQVRLRLAEAALYANQYATAEVLLRVLITESPDDLDVQKSFARSLMQQGKYNEARDLLEKIVERSPDDAATHRDLGIIYFRLNQPDLARPSLRAALAADPSDFLAQRVLDEIERSNPQPGIVFDKESGTLAISEGLLANSDADLTTMITVTLLKGNPEQAQEILQSIAETNGLAYAQHLAELAFPQAATDTEASHYDKAAKLFHAGSLPEALSEYKLAIAEDRDNASAYMGAGDCYYMMGQLNVATAFFEESIAIRPDHTTLTFLGDAHRKAGRREDAIRAYEQALKLNPNYALARQALSFMQEQSGRN